MDPIENPFAPGAGTPPPALVGRERLVEWADVALRRTEAGRPGRGIMVTGLRGVGKTVLLSHFISRANDLGLQNVMLEAREDGDFRRLLARELRPIVSQLNSDNPSQIVKRALAVFKSFNIGIGLDGTPTFGVDIAPEFGSADSGDIELDLRALFTAIGDAAKDRQTGVVLAINELQHLSQAELGALISAIHRTSQKQLPLLLFGAGLPNLPALAGQAKTYAERLFHFQGIGSLSPEEVARAIREPAAERGASFTDDAVAEIARITDGYPYFVQEWAHDAWNAAESSPITVEDVGEATTTVHERLDHSFFRVRMDRLTPAELRYLQAMAELGAGPHRSGTIAGVMDVDQRSVAPTREALIRKGMTYSPAYGETDFTAPLFGQFIQRNGKHIADSIRAARGPKAAPRLR